MSKPMHFYVVFNPLLNDKNSLYSTQAHEFYYQLKQRVKHTDKPFLYWGKLKVNEQDTQELSTYTQIIDTNLNQGDHSFLYITDYHHFWVAKIESVQKQINDLDDTLPFYEGKEVSTWFKVTDMDLISAEFHETGHYINQLFVDNKYEDMKIDHLSPYVGGLHFPLIVQDHNVESYFSSSFGQVGPRVLLENELIKNPQLVDEVKYQVNSFVLPPHVYSKLNYATKTHIINIETKISKQKKVDNYLSFQIFKTYAEVLESVLGDFLGTELKKEFGLCLYVNETGEELYDHHIEGSFKLMDFKGELSLAAIASFMNSNQKFGNLTFENIHESQHAILAYYKNKLHPFIEKYEVIARLNSIKTNPDYEFVIHQSEAFEFRNYILGVGSKGVINQLYRYIFESRHLDFKKVS